MVHWVVTLVSRRDGTQGRVFDLICYHFAALPIHEFDEGSIDTQPREMPSTCDPCSMFLECPAPVGSAVS